MNKETKICPNCQDSHEISYFTNRKGKTTKWCQCCCDQHRKWEKEHRSPKGQGKRARKKKEREKKEWLIDQNEKIKYFAKMDNQTLSEERKINFGKYKGWRVQNIPDDYLNWVTSQEWCPDYLLTEKRRRKSTSKT